MAGHLGAVVKAVLILTLAQAVFGNAVLTRMDNAESEQTRTLQQNRFKSFGKLDFFLILIVYKRSFFPKRSNLQIVFFPFHKDSNVYQWFVSPNVQSCTGKHYSRHFLLPPILLKYFRTQKFALRSFHKC